ncbi:MAG: ABC transporter ATP-binding protein [Actinobacteria bacterium]|nr:ABC transporter ATP-binding protein [Actinomycetota bacterium]
MNAIEVRNLTKNFGDFKALDGLDIDVPEGAVFGFLGPNGAGKTTTTRILVGLAHPTSGRIKILGRDGIGEPASIKRSIGYLPDVPAFYEWMKAGEYLAFAGEMFGLRGADLKSRVAALLDAAGLAEIDRKIGGFSRGMKQRLGIAQAFVNNPDVLFLDEPTSALDPIGRKEVLDMIDSLSEKKTVFFSTHILADVERVCDSVAIIDRGRLVIQGDLESIKQNYTRPTFSIELDADAAPLAEKLRGVPWVSSVASDGGLLTIDVSDIKSAQMELAGVVAGAGLPVRKLELKEIALEDIFVDLVEERNGKQTEKAKVLGGAE